MINGQEIFDNYNKIVELYNKFNELKKENEQLKQEKEQLKQQLEEFEEGKQEEKKYSIVSGGFDPLHKGHNSTKIYLCRVRNNFNLLKEMEK